MKRPDGTAIRERAQDLLGVGRVRGDDENRRDQILLGVVAMIMVVVMAAALGLVYLQPPGYRDYRAEFANASGVRVGDQVRVAGIQVGQVKEVAIDGARVRVRFSVESGVRVGDESSIAVKMLTPVGGRYLQLASKGGSLLGDGVIPAQHVTGTYNLTAIIEKATPKVEQIDGDKMRELLVAAQRTLTGSTSAIGTIIEASASLADEIGQRSEQLQAALEVSDEYVAATTRDRQVVFELFDSLAQVGVGLGVRYDQVRRVFNLLGRFFVLLDRLVTFYGDGFEKFVDEGAKLLAQLSPGVDAIEDGLRRVDTMLEQLRKSITPKGVVIDQSGRQVRGVEICVPNPVRSC